MLHHHLACAGPWAIMTREQDDVCGSKTASEGRLLGCQPCIPSTLAGVHALWHSLLLAAMPRCTGNTSSAVPQCAWLQPAKCIHRGPEASKQASKPSRTSRYISSKSLPPDCPLSGPLACF